MVPDPVQSPTMDMGEDDPADLPSATSALDLNDGSVEAQQERSRRVSSGVRLTEREQFQMYKAESGHGANVMNLRPDRRPEVQTPPTISSKDDISSPVEAHRLNSPSSANSNNITSESLEAARRQANDPNSSGRPVDISEPPVKNCYPNILADRLAAHESARSNSPSSTRATPGVDTPSSQHPRTSSPGFPFGQDTSRNDSPASLTAENLHGRPQMNAVDSNGGSSAFSSRAPTFSTMGETSPSLDRANMQSPPLDSAIASPTGEDQRTPLRSTASDAHPQSDGTVKGPARTASPAASPSKGLNDHSAPSPIRQPSSTVRTPSQTRPPMQEKKSVLGKLFPGKEEKKEREREREQKKQQQLQDQRDRAAANGLVSEDSGAESETASEKSSKGFGRIGRRMSSSRNQKEAKEGEPLSRPSSRNEDQGKLERKQSQSKEGGTSLRDLVSNSMTRKLSTTSRKSDDGKSDTESHHEKSNKGGNQTNSLLKKYGACEKVAIGKGATAVVRLAHKWDQSTEKLYAVKEFRKRRKNETEKEYVKKLTSEFCISSTLHHPNIVETVDLVQDENHHWCEVMEYCPGGDLYGAIKKGGMTETQIRSYFYQMISGVSYLHSMGVAHRDIKPENLLLDVNDVLKITDFGVSDVFRMCWEKTTHLSKGLCGSEPYIAPEQFEPKAEYDARMVDVWACAVVFYCMQHEELPWRVAKESDPSYALFRDAYHNSPNPPPLGDLQPKECRAIVKQMLNPNPKNRVTTEAILKDAWMQKISVLAPASAKAVQPKMPGNPQVKTAQP